MECHQATGCHQVTVGPVRTAAAADTGAGHLDVAGAEADLPDAELLLDILLDGLFCYVASLIMPNAIEVHHLHHLENCSVYGTEFSVFVMDFSKDGFFTLVDFMRPKTAQRLI